jgi:hypothetical protein
VFPRVVLGEAALRRAVEESHTGDLPTFESMLVADEDDKVFVNYLGDLPYFVEEVHDAVRALSQ